MFDVHLLSQFSVSNVFCQHSIHVRFASTQTTGTWANMRLSEHRSREEQLNPRERCIKPWPRYILIMYNAGEPIPDAARSNAWVCGRSLAGIVGSNPAGGTDVCMLQELCVVS